MNNKIWLILILTITICSCIGIWFILNNPISTGQINIEQNGKIIYSFDLHEIHENYEITIGGDFKNTISIENGRICVSQASCPDQICVKQGWLSEGIIPIVCLPNSLVISMHSNEKTLDGISR